MTSDRSHSSRFGRSLPDERTFMHTRPRRWFHLLVLALTTTACSAMETDAQTPVEVRSPDGRTVVRVRAEEGGLFYAVDRDGAPIVLASRLGFEFRDAPPLRDGLSIVGSRRGSVL